MNPDKLTPILQVKTAPAWKTNVSKVEAGGDVEARNAYPAMIVAYDDGSPWVLWVAVAAKRAANPSNRPAGLVPKFPFHPLAIADPPR
jgi:hypothetical protein